MNYKREHIATQEAQFNTWNEWTKNNQYNRTAIIGVGNFLNSVEGSIRQVRRSLQPSVQGNNSNGVIFFSMATSNVFTSSSGTLATAVANPYSVPPGQFTPTRSYAEFASGLTTGKSVNGATLYEPNALAPGFEAIFSQPAAIPVLPWKAFPTVGHLKGFAKRADNTPLDTATVTIRNLDTNAVRTGATDGGGFYGGVDLAPGQYLVKAVLGADTLYSCVANVTAGVVSDANVGVEDTAPITTASLNPAVSNGSNDWYTVNVDLSLSALDNCSGVERTEYSTDDGATWLPYTGTITLDQEGIFAVQYRSIDRAGNVENTGSTTVKIDKTAPEIQLTATPSHISPPDGRQVAVTINGSGSDAVSGLAGVSYVITDEYGTMLTIAPRPLTGNSSAWAENVFVEARRNGDDRDGRLYRVTATITDSAGLTATASVDIVVSHDQRR
jgi:hypothetical protein